MNEQAKSVPTAPTAMSRLIQASLHKQGGWMPFDRFMALALYAPGLGYYSSGQQQIGRMPSAGSLNSRRNCQWNQSTVAAVIGNMAEVIKSIACAGSQPDR